MLCGVDVKSERYSIFATSANIREVKNLEKIHDMEAGYLTVYQ